jgi:hypothetical protein
MFMILFAPYIGAHTLSMRVLIQNLADPKTNRLSLVVTAAEALRVCLGPDQAPAVGVEPSRVASMAAARTAASSH